MPGHEAAMVSLNQSCWGILLKDQILRSLTVRAPARIHCALLNESGVLDRIDGSVGFALCKPFWEMKVRLGSAVSNLDMVHSEHKRAIAFVLDRFRRKFAFNHEISIAVHHKIPPHIGLGSKTSLVMALGWALSRLVPVRWDERELATFLGRGGTSGVGVHAFSEGGFIWDAGRKFPMMKQEYGPSSEGLAPAPNKVICADLKGFKIVHFRFALQGASGLREIGFFK